MSSVFEGFLSAPEGMDAFGERSLVAAMLRFEAALAQAQADLGVIPTAAAQSIVGTCKVELFDAPKIVRESARAGSLAAPMLKSLRETVRLFNPEAVAFVHFGCSSQDLLDSAMALIARDVLARLECDVRTSAETLLHLAEIHADTPAAVSSLGAHCALWAAPLLRSLHRLPVARERALRVQLGGGEGENPHPGVQGSELCRQVAAMLGLGEPQPAGQSHRDEWVALGCELGLLTGSLGRIASDLRRMSRLETGGADQPRSTPVAWTVALASARRAPQRVAALLSGLPLEYAGDPGAWQSDHAEFSQLLMLAHASASAMATALPGLQPPMPG